MHELSMNILSIQGECELHKCTEVEGKETMNGQAEPKPSAPTVFPTYVFLSVLYWRTLKTSYWMLQETNNIQTFKKGFNTSVQIGLTIKCTVWQLEHLIQEVFETWEDMWKEGPFRAVLSLLVFPNHLPLAMYRHGLQRQMASDGQDLVCESLLQSKADLCKGEQQQKKKNANRECTKKQSRMKEVIAINTAQV